MKSLKLLLFIALSIFLTSCATKQITLNKQDYYTDKKVAVIIYKPLSSAYKTGSQGLLDMAVTPQKKYKEALNSMDSIYNKKIDAALHLEVKKIYEYINKNYVIVDNIASIPILIENNKEILDFEYIKNTYNVSHVQVISPTYGIVSQYQGFIETDRNATVSIESTITDLNTKAKIQQYNKLSKTKIKNKWKDNDYALLKESFHQTLEIALRDFSSQF